VLKCIVVASGKGGVGKTTVAANLAVELAKAGRKVGILDCDIYCPTLHLVLKPINPKVIEDLEKEQLIPVETEVYGVDLFSTSMFFDRGTGIVWRGKQVREVIRTMCLKVRWSHDYLIVDLPPGTGDEMEAAIRYLKERFDNVSAVLVTMPHKMAHESLLKCKDVLDFYKVPVIALVENFSDIFHDRSDDIAIAFGLVLLKIAYRRDLAQLGIVGGLPAFKRLALLAGGIT